MAVMAVIFLLPSASAFQFACFSPVLNQAARYENALDVVLEVTRNAEAVLREAFKVIPDLAERREKEGGRKRKLLFLLIRQARILRHGGGKK